MHRHPSHTCLRFARAATLAAWILCPVLRGQSSNATDAPASGAVEYVIDTSWPKDGSKALGAVSGVAVDADDSVWVFRRAKPFVEVIDREGVVRQTWPAATFVKPHQIRLSPDGSVWVSDYIGQVVQKYSREGELLVTLGTKGKSGTDKRHFDMPTDIAVAPDTGDLFVTDGYGNARIVHFNKQGQYLGEFGHHGKVPGEMNLPHSLVTDSQGRLYEADRDNGRLQVFDQTGRVLQVWDFMTPWGLWITKSDEIWICGTAAKPKNQRLWNSAPPHEQWVARVSTAGAILGRWQFPRATEDHCKPGELSWVHCIAVDSHENLYLGDVRGNGLQKFSPKKKD